MRSEKQNTSEKVENMIYVAGEDLKFKKQVFNDRRVAVDQILRKLGNNPTLEFRLVELTFPGTKSFDNDEEVDIDTETPRYFIVGKTDRLFCFAIDDIPYDSPFEKIGEPQLREMVGIEKDKVLVLAREGQPDLELKSGDFVQLCDKGTERIYCREIKEKVTVWFESKSYELNKGHYKYGEIAKLFPIPDGYMLSYEMGNGSLTQFNEGESIDLRCETTFFARPPRGESS